MRSKAKKNVIWWRLTGPKNILPVRRTFRTVIPPPHPSWSIQNQNIVPTPFSTNRASPSRKKNRISTEISRLSREITILERKRWCITYFGSKDAVCSFFSSWRREGEWEKEWRFRTWGDWRSWRVLADAKWITNKEYFAKHWDWRVTFYAFM